MIKIKYTGFNEFAKELSSVKLEKVLNKGLVLAGTLIQNSLKKETPVDTGTLQRNFDTKPGNLFYTIENRTKYGHFVNGGTRYIKANPFMERGVEKVREKAEIIFFSQLRKEFS